MKNGFYRVLVATFFSVAVFVMPTEAVEIRLNSEDLPAELLTQVLKAKEDANKAKNGATVVENLTPETAYQWAEIGKNIGLAISEAAKAMSVSVNEFAGTFVGKITVVLIVWKVIGQDMWSIGGGTMFWIALTSILAWSYRRHHHKLPVVHTSTRGDKTETSTTYRTTVELGTDEAVVSMWVHVILFVLATVWCSIIVF